jgi:hypothetical protein
MVMVCKEHVAEGLHLLPVPHVKGISKNKKIPCYFCEQPATIQLFLFNNLKEQENIELSKPTIQKV